MKVNENKPKKSFGNKFADTFIPNKKDSKQRIVGKIITSIASIVLIISLIMLGLVIAKYARANKNNVDNKDKYNPSSDTSSATSGDNAPTDAKPAEEEIDAETGVVKDFVDLYKTNSDVVGWIKIPGTKLDLAVAKGKDNSYYLNHTLEKTSDAFGVPFADFRTTFSPSYQSTNVTIYGHAAKDGSFFSPVKDYKDLDFYKKHPVMTFNTIYGKGEYKIIGRFMEYVDGNNEKMFNYHDYVDLNEASVNKFIDNVKKRSYFVAPVDAKFGDQFITLSTCNTEIVNSNKTPYRDVLVARKVRPGESVDVDVAKAENNVDQLMPDGWVKKFGKKNPFSK